MNSRWLLPLLVLCACRAEVSFQSRPQPAASTESPADSVPRAAVAETEPVPTSEPDEVPRPDVDDSKILSSYETTFAGDGPRGLNVRTAALRANSDVAPGATWSFNAAVGPRTKKEGFAMAPVISDGELSSDWGGGTCQVSSTVHAAAIMAGLEVLKRTSHSRPSAYIRQGLDATVLLPPECSAEPRPKDCYVSDLVLRNPYQVSVGIRVSTVRKANGQSVLTAQIVGRDKDFTVDYAWAPEKATDFEHRMRKVPGTLAPKLKQKGSPGAGGSSTVTYSFPDGTKKVVKYRSTYKPVDEVWEVPADWSESSPPWAASQ